MKDDIFGVPRLGPVAAYYLSTRPGSDSRQSGKRRGDGEGAAVEAAVEGRRVDGVKHAHPGAERGLCGGCDECNSDTKTITVTEYSTPVAVQPYMIPGSFADVVRHVFTQAERLLLDKHKNYGPTNISRSPGGPLNGLRVRMWDKIARLNHMIDNGVEDAVGEALEETLMDLANYALIGVLVLRGEWPDE